MRILEAARAVFVADPDAPISAVAEQPASVSAPSTGATRQGGAAAAAVRGRPRALCRRGRGGRGRRGDPWTAFAEFMRRVVDADTHALTIRLAGTFEPTDGLRREARGLTSSPSRWSSERGRPVPSDRTSQRRTSRASSSNSPPSASGDEERTSELRRRYLTLQLDALHGSRTGDLPGRAPSWQEISQRWER